jgi:hypothetical protein
VHEGTRFRGNSLPRQLISEATRFRGNSLSRELVSKVRESYYRTENKIYLPWSDDGDLRRPERP